MAQDLAGIWAAASEDLLTYPLTEPVRAALLTAMSGPQQVSGCMSSAAVHVQGLCMMHSPSLLACQCGLQIVACG